MTTTLNQDQKELYETLDDLCCDGGLAMVIGPRGVGKTQVCVSLALDNHPNHAYSRAADILMDIRAAFKEGGKVTEQDVVDRYCTPKLLIIDEGQERRHNQFEHISFVNIIDRRYADIKPTIIIANASPEDMRQQWGESVWDRLMETGACYDCSDWKSWRVK